MSQLRTEDSTGNKMEQCIILGERSDSSLGPIAGWLNHVTHTVVSAWLEDGVQDIESLSDSTLRIFGLHSKVVGETVRKLFSRVRI